MIAWIIGLSVVFGSFALMILALCRMAAEDKKELEIMKKAGASHDSNNSI